MRYDAQRFRSAADFTGRLHRVVMLQIQDGLAIRGTPERRDGT